MAEPLTWTAHPIREEPAWKSACLVLLIVSISLLIGWSFQSRTFSWLSCACLGLSMSRYFFPTQYTVRSSGLLIAHLGIRRNLEWPKFARVDRHPNGIFLSPYAHPHRLDTFRGQFLKTGHQTSEILHAVQQHLQAKSP
ncbi:MAG: hypothetical protein O3B73_18355 [bacterium]|nr:hypothetical protein [bacterium]